MADLVRDVSAAVSISSLNDVLEDLVLALQHGAVVRGAGEEGTVDLVALFHYFTARHTTLIVSYPQSRDWDIDTDSP